MNLLVRKVGIGEGNSGVTESVVAGVVCFVVGVGGTVSVDAGVVISEVGIGITVEVVESELTALYREEMPSSTSCTLLPQHEVRTHEFTAGAN